MKKGGQRLKKGEKVRQGVKRVEKRWKKERNREVGKG